MEKGAEALNLCGIFQSIVDDSKTFRNRLKTVLVLLLVGDRGSISFVSHRPCLDQSLIFLDLRLTTLLPCSHYPNGPHAPSSGTHLSLTRTPSLFIAVVTLAMPSAASSMSTMWSQFLVP